MVVVVEGWLDNSSRGREVARGEVVVEVEEVVVVVVGTGVVVEVVVVPVLDDVPLAPN